MRLCPVRGSMSLLSAWLLAPLIVDAYAMRDRPERIDRLAQMRPSAIREVHNLAQRLKHRHASTELIPLHFGESSLGTPPFIVEAACDALRQGAVFYENNGGRDDLKQALADFYRQRYSVDVASDQFVITCGATQAILLTMLAVLSPGDTMINVTPNWPNFTEAARIAGATVEDVPLQFDLQRHVFELDFDRLQAVITQAESPRLLVVNSPSNPTGWVITSSQQQQLFELCARYGLILLSDEIYDRIVFSESRSPTALDLADELDLIVVINGFSKTYCMTGWRLGYLMTSSERAQQMARMQEFVVSHAPSMAQVAALTALREGEPWIAENLDRYCSLRDLVHDELSVLPGADIARADGSFYTFFRLPQSRDSLDFCERLVASTGVVLAPGCAFGAGGEGWLRLCFAHEPQLLKSAIAGLHDFVADG